MTTPIKFGTDGWRAIIAEDFTFDNVRLCAQSTAEYFRSQGRPQSGVVVGYDTRFASEHFAAAVAEVLAANGIPVYLASKVIPTPVASFSVQQLGAAGGVVITASHNPGSYNGFKVKDHHAGSAPPEAVAQIEERIPEIQRTGRVQRMPLAQAQAQAAGLVRPLDPDADYLAHIRALVGPERIQAIKDAGLTIAVDSMYGAGAGYTARLLRGGRTRIVEMHAQRNPAFPGIAQPEPITRNLGKLLARVPRLGAAVGLATDGDADRLGVVDEHGRFLTQLQVFSLLALYLLEARGARGALVKTITMSSMVYRLGERFGVPVAETDVGFKYVGPEMVRRNALIGGEESGGYGFRGHIPERDGILAGLYFLDFMVQTGKTPSQLVDHLYQTVGPHYYDRIDLHFPPDQRAAIIGRVVEGHPEYLQGSPVAQAGTYRDDLGNLSGVRFMLQDGSWLLIRFSGTEPVLRIYAETNSPERVARLLQDGRRLAGV
ncbi:MAG: phosphoglucomutase/phosphomannomutase family protein [Chloroflexi bacterium]|nr:phosphoglucomutase/phosphomannomutase family protein [Chloroflexota bacterium]